MKIGDKVKKIKGFKYIGVLLCKYRNTDGEWYGVVELPKTRYSDKLQHIYKLDQLKKI